MRKLTESDGAEFYVFYDDGADGYVCAYDVFAYRVVNGDDDDYDGDGEWDVDDDGDGDVYDVVDDGVVYDAVDGDDRVLNRVLTFLLNYGG